MTRNNRQYQVLHSEGYVLATFDSLREAKAFLAGAEQAVLWFNGRTAYDNWNGADYSSEPKFINSHWKLNVV